ncbi:phage baseplate assembly protein V [Phytohabitans suffuscus]|uniref:Type IV secretion protein Rhs n=1 Tax=Phytohabitans suffuscus TaxID=624315 RepID=A0A6F8YRU8_9ACTN|nr:phage baseplate assembly protein V [Phytohabitans suffuscus]BCB88713.1 type IV secretion protein Rhs [Phytohabitans suffuscus]
MLPAVHNDTIRAGVTIGGRPLPAAADRHLVRVVVDTQLQLPDMFELTFRDEAGQLLNQAGIEIGTAVTVSARSAAGRPHELIAGEVTAIEAVCEQSHVWTVVRGYSKLHRLQRIRRTRTFVNMTDANIAKQIAGEHGLPMGKVAATGIVHAHLAQLAQTDWEFLTQRAREIGYEVGVTDGRFDFRAATAVPAGPLGAFRALGGDAVTVRFKHNLFRFAPRLTAATMVPAVEVRVWDADTPKAVSARAETRAGTADLDQTPQEFARMFTGVGRPQPPGAGAVGAPGMNTGPAPGRDAYVVADRPVGVGQAANAAAGQLAQASARRLAGPFAEAEGIAQGDHRIRAGGTLTVEGVPPAFVGTWIVSRARHVFDEDQQGGYLTHFEAGGGQDRSLLGLTGRGNGPDRSGPLHGLVCGIVTNNNDPDKQGRVKISLPWLSPRHESDWARVALPGLGRKGGLVLPPEVGDEVLVGFEFDDPRRPYVIGGLHNPRTKAELGGPVVKVAGRTGSVARTGIVSGSGNRLVFRDELPPSGGPPSASSITLGTGDDAISMEIDQNAGRLRLNCRPTKGSGQIVLECANGAITIRAKTQISIVSDGQLSIEGAQVNVKAKAAMKLESSGPLELKGAVIKLN